MSDKHRVSIPHVDWRKGRPRFNPGKALRAAGHKGHDLKTADGWMTAGECLDWSRAFSSLLAAERHKASADRARIRKERQREARRAVPPAPVRRSFTLGQLLEAYAETGMIGKAPGTARNYRVMVRNFEVEAPEAWASEAEALSRPVVIGIYEQLLRTRSVHTARQMIRVLSAAWNWALDRGRVETANPVFRIRTIDPKPRTRAIGVAEYLHLVAVADANRLAHVGDMLSWGVWTAQRTGDRLMMRPANIVSGRLEITQMKTGADVSIPLSAELDKRWRWRAHGGDFVIPNVAAVTHVLRLQNYRRDWLRLIALAQVDMPSVAGLHDQDLRDTALSWMGRAGCTTQQIYAVSGHRQQGETRILRHYMAADFEFADQAIGRLEKWFNKEVRKLKGEKK